MNEREGHSMRTCMRSDENTDACAVRTLPLGSTTRPLVLVPLAFRCCSVAVNTEISVNLFQFISQAVAGSC